MTEIETQDKPVPPQDERRVIATAALSGLLASPHVPDVLDYKQMERYELYAKLAVRHADALIAELEATKIMTESEVGVEVE